MDFLGSYIPTTPSKYTPRGNGTQFDDFLAATAPCDEEQLESMRSGNYDDVRKNRKELEKKPRRVRFIAPLSKEDESLQSIFLTPRVPVFTEVETPRGTESPGKNGQNPTGIQKSEQKGRDKITIFGFRLRKSLPKH